MLKRVRAGLLKKGDDGSAGAPRATVNVAVGWAEMRAIYAMHNQLSVARKARNDFKGKVKKVRVLLEQAQGDIHDHDLLNNRAVVSLLVDVERLLSGEEDSQLALHETHKRVKTLIARANKSDRRRRVRI
jgi:hypothetical protein